MKIISGYVREDNEETNLATLICLLDQRALEEIRKIVQEELKKALESS